jgi:hypothetical protein
MSENKFIATVVTVALLLGAVLIGGILYSKRSRQARPMVATQTEVPPPSDQVEGRNPPRANVAPTEVLPAFEVLNDEPSEMVGKAQIAQDILLKGIATKDQLTALLHHLFDQAMQRTGFRFRTHPNAVYICVFESHEHYHGSYSWLARLAYNENAGDEVPHIDICEPALEALGHPEVKFGLTEKQRKEIFWELVVLEDRARQEAEALYPLPRGGEFSRVLWRDALEKQNVHAEQRREEWEAVLRGQYGVTKEQAEAISVEGGMKHWPMPNATGG